MSAIFCRLIFHDFGAESIDEFRKLIAHIGFKTLHELITQSPVSLDSELSEKNTEVKFSFRLNNGPGGRKLDRVTKYYQICLAIAELTGQFEALRKKFFLHHGLPDHSTITMTILSKNIYPQFFKLQNVFSMEKLAFGSIVGRRNFNPTFVFDEPKDERNEHKVFELFLDEQRSLKDINSNMLIFFEHDSQLLTICFPDVWKNWIPKKDDDTRSPNRVVDIRVAYSGIRRVVVAISPDTDDGFKVSFTFQLNYPPVIRVYEMSDGKGMDATKTKFKYPKRCLTWNDGYDLQNSISHGSCLVADCRMSDARTLLDCLDRLRKFSHYAIEFRVLHRQYPRNIKNYSRNFLMYPDYLPPKYAKLKEPKYFPLVYAVQALITRGGELYDYMFRPEYRKIFEFMDFVIDHFETDLSNSGARITKTVTTLENMLVKIDKSNDISEPLKFFLRLYEEPEQRIFAEITDDLAREGYMRVRKIVVTPTRKLFLNPELIMGNRSLRKKGADNMLRITFRDDDNKKVSALPYFLIKKTVTKTLTDPLNVGFRDFSYLCSSNSQLRDHGCYFLAGSPAEVSEFRESCGRFKIESISKMMSRMGQCFTQARQLGIEITRNSYSEIFDIIGGSDGNGKPYTFSDGCGKMSEEFCRRCVEDLKLGNCRPSCLQIRFRGFKGVITVDTHLDKTKQWAEANKRLPKSKESLQHLLPWYAQSILFRPSQKKFNGPREKHVEIVKISSPIHVSLNKPLINILDQVSEKQGEHGHKRMCDRIHELLENHVESTMSSLIEETNAFLVLNNFPKYILYDNLRDFNVTEEPFFRSMLRSSALVQLHRLVDKMKIRIPSSQGRMMFGVIDESGYLQHGQVFIQYTTNASLKYPTPNAHKIIHKGRVMITKNPSVVAGDVRMLEAVDIPCLHGLVDVVVFPQSGPRPHPNEMAGSDLDGDEYSVFFDSTLFLDHNEPAFDFTSTTSNRPMGISERENLTTQMIDFFTLYVSQDSVGTIANAHLANSDLYGIDSEHCHNIALKHNQAVDFPKNGQVPETLTKFWNDKSPPEKVERFPNFMAKDHVPSYKSTRLLGKLYTRAMEIREIIRIEEIVSTDEKIKLDESVLMPDDGEYEDIAKSAYDEYRTLIGDICESFGILNEGQLFSGCFMAFKKRFTDKSIDETTASSTKRIVEEQVASIFAKFRTKFFDEFGGIEMNTEMDITRFNGIRETFRRACSHPSEEMRKKASAYYRVAYTSGKFLSFGWLVSDILSFNRQKYLLQPANFKPICCPLTDYLSNHINETCTSDIYKEEFEQFCKSIQRSFDTNESNQIVSIYVAKMCHKFLALDKLLFFCRKWIERHGNCYDKESGKGFKPKLMDAVVVKFGLGDLKPELGGWLTAASMDTENNIMEKFDLEKGFGGLGKKFWSLIRYMMTRSFGFSEKIELEPVTEIYLKSDFCLKLYFAAEETFYPIAVNRRFECLPQLSDDTKVLSNVTEGNTFVLEVPHYAQDSFHLFEKLSTKCGCNYVVMRKKPVQINTKSSRIALKPVGKFSAIRKFRSLLEVVPNANELDLQKRSNMIAEEVYKRLQFYAEEGRNLDDVFVA